MFIIVRLIGGLGNQLFQYSTAKALSCELSVPLKIDITAFEKYDLHKFSLSHFRISSLIASKDDLKNFPGRTGASIPKRLFSKLITNNRNPVYRQKDFGFDKNIFKLKPPFYLEGYWQSEKYFHKYRSIIRNELKFKNSFDDKSEIIARKIVKSNSISLHVRRCDYITNRNNRDIHGVPSILYYQKAVDIIKQKISTPKFFVFSDDILWAEDNLKFDWESTFISHNGPNNNYQDLRLMSLCKHNIIANSTFSWWGAWLNLNDSKIVIAPSKWFLDDSINACDLIPDAWLKL